MNRIVQFSVGFMLVSLVASPLAAADAMGGICTWPGAPVTACAEWGVTPQDIYYPDASVGWEWRCVVGLVCAQTPTDTTITKEYLMTAPLPYVTVWWQCPPCNEVIDIDPGLVPALA